MAQKSKTKNYKTNNLRGGNHHTHACNEDAYLVRNFNAAVDELERAIHTYKRFEADYAPVRICMRQLELVEHLLITCFIMLNGVSNFKFVNPSYEEIIREALTLIS